MGASRLLRIARTARRLPPSQLLRRLRFLWQRRRYAADPAAPIRRARADAEAAGYAAPSRLVRLGETLLAPDGSKALSARAAALREGRFGFLNREVRYGSEVLWRDPAVSPLWAYQMHYLGAVLDLVLSGEEAAAAALLASWRKPYESAWDPVAWHPYPVSVRATNLCFAAGAAGGLSHLGAGTEALLATHAAYLLRHLETDVRGNHLLENACALLAVSRTLEGGLADACGMVGERVMRTELAAQVLPDGGHFELSPLYHTLVLHRLTQLAALCGPADELTMTLLRPAGERMAAFLADVLCPDRGVPLLGDSVRGFGPHPTEVLTNARRLGWDMSDTSEESNSFFPDTGLYVWRGRGMWAVLDAGRVCPDALPAHGQADTLTVEIWLGGHCVVTDPGVHDYSGPERAWGRSSRAHSTITLDDLDNSEVYDSFRVGGRARVLGVRVDGDRVDARVRPFGRRAVLERTVRFGDAARRSLEILDRVRRGRRSIARSRLHLHPAVRVRELRDADCLAVLDTPGGEVHVRGEHPLVVEAGRASREFGMVETTSVIVQQLLGTSKGRTGSYLVSPVGKRRP